MSFARALEHNLTRADCRAKAFTGIREDKIIGQFEVWVNGEIKKEINVALGMEGLAKAYEEQFGLLPGSIKV